MSATMRRVWLGLAVAVAVFNVVAGLAVAVGATDDSGSGRVGVAGVMLLGGAAAALGLSLRGNRERWGNMLIALGVLPALLWFWYLAPAVVAITVVAGAIAENRHLRHVSTAPQPG